MNLRQQLGVRVAEHVGGLGQVHHGVVQLAQPGPHHPREQQRPGVVHRPEGVARRHGLLQVTHGQLQLARRRQRPAHQPVGHGIRRDAAQDAPQRYERLRGSTFAQLDQGQVAVHHRGLRIDPPRALHQPAGGGEVLSAHRRATQLTERPDRLLPRAPVSGVPGPGLPVEGQRPLKRAGGALHHAGVVEAVRAGLRAGEQAPGQLPGALGLLGPEGGPETEDQRLLAHPGRSELQR